MRSIFGPSGALFQLASLLLLLLLLSVSWSLRLSARRVPSFASSSCTHVPPLPPPPPSFSLFPIVSYLLLDKRWCISSLGVKSCQVYSALSFLRTKRARRVSITITLFISIGGEEKRFPDIVYLCIVIFSATRNFRNEKYEQVYPSYA